MNRIELSEVVVLVQPTAVVQPALEVVVPVAPVAPTTAVVATMPPTLDTSFWRKASSVFSDDPVSKRVGAEQKVFPMIIDFVYDSLVCVLPR